MKEFTIHTEETASDASVEILKRTKKGMGFIPKMHGIMVGAPTLLRAYKEIGKIFSESTFTSVGQEIIEMTFNQVIGYKYCLAAQTDITMLLLRLGKFKNQK
jgi:hypothetical protein